MLLDITAKQVKNQVEHAEKVRIQEVIRQNANLKAKVIKILVSEAD
jgi:hypothetical protein